MWSVSVLTFASTQCRNRYYYDYYYYYYYYYYLHHIADECLCVYVMLLCTLVTDTWIQVHCRDKETISSRLTGWCWCSGIVHLILYFALFSRWIAFGMYTLI